jgi:hypothetical protein
VGIRGGLQAQPASQASQASLPVWVHQASGLNPGGACILAPPGPASTMGRTGATRVTLRLMILWTQPTSHCAPSLSGRAVAPLGTSARWSTGTSVRWEGGAVLGGRFAAAVWGLFWGVASWRPLRVGHGMLAA